MASRRSFETATRLDLRIAKALHSLVENLVLRVGSHANVHDTILVLGDSASGRRTSGIGSSRGRTANRRSGA